MNLYKLDLALVFIITHNIDQIEKNRDLFEEQNFMLSKEGDLYSTIMTIISDSEDNQ